MNCSSAFGSANNNKDAWQDTMCKVYDIVLQEVSGFNASLKLNCRYFSNLLAAAAAGGGSSRWLLLLLAAAAAPAGCFC